MTDATHATVIMYDHDKPSEHTGKIVKRYPLGLTIDDEFDIRCYATFDRVKHQFSPHASTNAKAQQAELFR